MIICMNFIFLLIFYRICMVLFLLLEKLILHLLSSHIHIKKCQCPLVLWMNLKYLVAQQSSLNIVAVLIPLKPLVFHPL